MGLSIKVENVYIKDYSLILTKKEKNILGNVNCDYVFNDLYCTSNSFEKADVILGNYSIKKLLEKTKLDSKDIDLFIGGELSNQLFSTSFNAAEYEFNYIGNYAACSSLILSLINASTYLQYNTINKVLCTTSSNFGLSERQFRNPLSYGIQKEETTTITSSGGVSVLLSKEKNKVKVDSFTIGRCLHSHEELASDMGKIMAQACYQTLIDHLKNLHKNIDDYDLILTGDLSHLGRNILMDLLKNDNLSINNIVDAGDELFNDKNDFQGASGPTVIGVIFFTRYYNSMKKGKIKRALLLGTGSLHNKNSVLQQMDIPVISHCIELTI